MNTTLQDQLVEILRNVQNATKATGDFVISQLPDIAQSYISYGRFTSILSFVVTSILFGISLYITLKKGFFNTAAVYTTYWNKGEWLTSRLAAAIVGSCCSAFCLFFTIISFQEVVLVWIAPKVWLLRELAMFLKT